MGNIVQAVFFHVNVSNAPSLAALFSECNERLDDSLELALHGVEHNLGIKTVVRFYDESDTVTALTLQAKKAAETQEDFVKRLWSAGWLRRKLLARTHRKIVAKRVALKRDCMVETYACLRHAILSANQIAIEKSDHRFRMAYKDELHELYESVASANAMWLFIFKPNILLADKNTLVTHLW